MIEDECGEITVSAKNNTFDLPDNSINTDKCVDKSAVSKRGNCSEADKIEVEVINSDNLLGCLLTCGSQRLSTVMYSVVRSIPSGRVYSVVRSIPSGREFVVCSAQVPGAKLPGMTYLKEKLKPYIKMNLLPKHQVIQVGVDCSRSVS